MATSGTYNFSMDIDEVIEEAMEMIGGEATLGNEPRSARRSINLLLQDWQNRGIQLWTVGTTTVTVTTSVTSYVLSDENIDVLEAVVNRDDIDLQLERISMEEYLKVPRKGQTGRPTQFAVRRERDQSRVYLWPIPENSTDAIKFETVKYFQDVSKSSQTADISRRFYPCLTAGAAYFMSMKRPGVDAGRIQMIKGEYEERLLRAQEEDKERASMYILPRLR
ncbi:MAG TPA: hypothetical protein VMW50_07160 [Dehalococcoidia bacterium]|jgi:hypothetical protein|nr:hypothetical protein [Dehalococcoidia bacterium]